MTTVIRAAWPPVISVIGSTPVVALVHAHENGDNIPAALVRTALGVGIVITLVAGWVRRRDEIAVWFRNATHPPRPAGTNEETT